MTLQNVKTVEYALNTSPRIGDLVRLSGEIRDGVDTLYRVVDFLLGRVGNKVLIEPANPLPGTGNFTQREYYYTCLCPQ